MEERPIGRGEHRGNAAYKAVIMEHRRLLARHRLCQSCGRRPPTGVRNRGGGWVAVCKGCAGGGVPMHPSVKASWRRLAAAIDR